jgi:carboxymethylenebutenolidase
MCFPPEAVPPPVPDSLLVTDDLPRAQAVELTADDGAVLSAAFALAPEPGDGGAAVLILPDVRGLFGYYSNLARSFAATGHSAIAIDYFGRTAGASARDADFDYMPHVKQTTPQQVQADLRAARGHLAEISGATSFITVGFCFGGTQSYLATTDPGLGLAGAVAFYGGLNETRLGVFPHPAGEARRMSGPILALYGGADAGIGEDLRDEFDAALTDAGVDHEFVVYPGAPHSFFDRAHDDFTDECTDAWRRTLGFLASVG